MRTSYGRQPDGTASRALREEHSCPACSVSPQRWMCTVDSKRSLGYIPTSIMIPSRRMGALLAQAQAYQRQQCVYHNVPHPVAGHVVEGDSLYVDHECDTASFPRVTTLILDEHQDEVWTLAWSHAGDRLATGGKDRRVIVWRINVGNAVFGQVRCAHLELHAGRGRPVVSRMRY
jgi:hypothetical protein